MSRASLRFDSRTKGEYSSVGGRMYEGGECKIVIQETVMSRIGVDRVLKFAFELAQSRPKKHLTSATKSNGISITMHGSAPDIAGRGVANPIGQIWSGAQMLDLLGHRDAHDAVIDPAAGGPKTPDLGGTATTADLERAIAEAVRRA